MLPPQHIQVPPAVLASLRITVPCHACITSPHTGIGSNRNQRFILRNDNPNGGDDPDLVITALELLHEGRRKELYRGTLAEPIEDAQYVACKVAYSQNAMRKLRHEVALYQGRLKPL